MPQYTRSHVPGGTFFFTVALLERRHSLLIDRIADLREVFRVVRSQRPFEIDAIVILPDHLHCLWTLPTDAVKHGYVTRAADWLHSSIHRFMADGRIPSDWAAGPETDALQYE